MLATFQVKNSTVELNGLDISGLSNNIEVTISSKTDKQPTGRLNGKAEVSIKQKMFLKKDDLSSFLSHCNQSLGTSYRFTREALQYTIKEIDILISKEDPIAGVVPIELLIGSGTLPLRTRI